jgi:hypothetical protein
MVLLPEDHPVPGIGFDQVIPSLGAGNHHSTGDDRHRSGTTDEPNHP